MMTETITQATFSYNAPSADAPAFLLVRYDGKAHTLKNGDAALTVDLKPVPPEANGLISIVFNDAYYPLTFYVDGEAVWIPILSADQTIEVLVPLHNEDEKTFIIYPMDPDKLPGNARIVISDPGTDPSIGILIVGTSGLTEPE